MNWRLKVAAKLMLSRLPVPYPIWRRLSMFRHGRMDDPEYALSVVARHMRNAGLERLDGMTVLELGPGDSVASAIIARAYGASRIYLVDAVRAARTDTRFYAEMIAHLQSIGIPSVEVSTSDTLAALLERCNAVYLTGGLASLREIPSNDVDFAWSHAVLEHVRLADLLPTLRELKRVVRDSGITSHRIDFEDHLAESLNSLRFPSTVWESSAFHQSGFYTNRVRSAAMLRMFNEAGFTEIQPLQLDRWEVLPVPASRLSRDYRSMAADDLCVRGGDIRTGPGEVGV